jgi:hypothetical protein
MPGDSKSRKSKSVKSIKAGMKSSAAKSVKSTAAKSMKSKSIRSKVASKKPKRPSLFNNISYEKTFTKKIEKKDIPQFSIGKDVTSYESNVSFAPEDEFMDLVYNKISDGPQFVSLPVPQWRHAFLVDIQPNNQRIMISDWRGDHYKTVGLKKIGNVKNRNYVPRWEQYSNLMVELEKRYGWPIEYYPVDEEIFNNSYEHNEMCKGGGCSHYVYAWAEKYKKVYFPDYR